VLSGGIRRGIEQLLAIAAKQDGTSAPRPAAAEKPAATEATPAKAAAKPAKRPAKKAAAASR
jgi:hypothetical protein